ncbi:uncharacterized protein LOC104585299 isoform X2 [Brachypodium distachyon]|uniref:uncharacterized protein LOC104585299 isoform X2 n=1 Tax=Brachypodium distachyon TaxID=15368 RepID=UPI000D0CEDD3|nr:uncharacterized protein LOC104585299 isoform X2 [Brachypodium distachyon]|eukprot:XP_024312156.1 uncharacterized protein LOC104585299 isoform X2 [Brachypodium distachyon]
MSMPPIRHQLLKSSATAPQRRRFLSDISPPCHAPPLPSILSATPRPTPSISSARCLPFTAPSTCRAIHRARLLLAIEPPHACVFSLPPWFASISSKRWNRSPWRIQPHRHKWIELKYVFLELIISGARAAAEYLPNLLVIAAQLKDPWGKQCIGLCLWSSQLVASRDACS